MTQEWETLQLEFVCEAARGASDLARHFSTLVCES